MAVKKFELESLSELDGGRIREAFDQAMRRCEMDCKDRPGLSDPRKLTLTMEMVPVISEDGQRLESCNLQFQVKDQCPPRKSKAYNMHSRAGGLLWNEMSPEDLKQGSLDDATGPKEVVTDAS